jgi:hypothetical protein
VRLGKRHAQPLRFGSDSIDGALPIVLPKVSILPNCTTEVHIQNGEASLFAKTNAFYGLVATAVSTIGK